jgi:hypothetical protein
LLQSAEQFIHATLIGHLSGIDSVALFQDPPADLLVTAPDGRRTGQLPSGVQVSEIPGAAYLKFGSRSMVVIVEPKMGTFQTKMIGTPRTNFYLSMSTDNFLGNLNLFHGRIENVRVFLGDTSVELEHTQANPHP